MRPSNHTMQNNLKNFVFDLKMKSIFKVLKTKQQKNNIKKIKKQTSQSILNSDCQSQITSSDICTRLINNQMQKQDKQDSENINQLDIAFIADQSRQPSSQIGSYSQDRSISISLISKNTPSLSYSFEHQNQISNMQEWNDSISMQPPKRLHSSANRQNEQSNLQTQKMVKGMKRKVINGKYTRVKQQQSIEIKYNLRSKNLSKINQDNSSSSQENVFRNIVEQIGQPTGNNRNNQRHNNGFKL